MVRKILLIIFAIAVFVGIGFSPVVGQELKSPSLVIVAPEDGQVANGHVEMKFAVDNFELTARPDGDKRSGVVALYVDGKFYTTAATASATVQLSRFGTHRIDAELVEASRLAVIPRVSDSVMIHNQKKTPYLFVSNVRNGSVLYTNQPTLQVELSREQYEDQNSYYQVFVDGVVDGDSTVLSDTKRYLLQKPLVAGKHRIRVALYGENGKPYSPVVDTVMDITYVDAKPSIQSLQIPETNKPGDQIQFESVISQFKIPENGQLQVVSGDKEWSFASSSGELRGLPAGEHKLVFSLVDQSGFSITPPVLAEKTILVGEVDGQKTAEQSALAGLFMTAGDGSGPNWGLLSLALLQAAIILVFGVVLMVRHRNH